MWGLGRLRGGFILLNIGAINKWRHAILNCPFVPPLCPNDTLCLTPSPSCVTSFMNGPLQKTSIWMTETRIINFKVLLPDLLNALLQKSHCSLRDFLKLSLWVATSLFEPSLFLFRLISAIFIFSFFDTRKIEIWCCNLVRISSKKSKF